MARPRGRSNRPHPPVSLSVAERVPRTITDSNAGHPMNRLLLAEAMGYSPSSSRFRERITSSTKYGLTEGNYSSETLSLTPLGTELTRPRNEQERSEARREAMRTIPFFDSALDHFKNAKLPAESFLKNILEREPFNIDPSWSVDAAKAFIEDAKFVGYLRDINGSSHIVIEHGSPAPSVIEDPSIRMDEIQPREEINEIKDVPPPSIPNEDIPLPVKLFIAHGKNRKTLEQLKDILNSLKVPFLVAIDEPNAGRPISEKVAETMKACSAGIFIFTSDEELTDENGEVVFRPSQNVVYELGAASLLYGRKIVILKEAGVNFPSDFSDLGRIEFEKDSLDAKAMDLLRELIALDALKLVSAGID